MPLVQSQRVVTVWGRNHESCQRKLEKELAHHPDCRIISISISETNVTANLAAVIEYV